MKTFIRSLLMTAAVGATLLTPISSQAASAARHYQLTTRILEQRPAVGEYDGTMQLTVTPDGIVSGFYRPSDGRFVAVTGGVSDTTFWLDIGSMSSNPLHFTGTFKDGRINADAFSGDRNLLLVTQPKQA
jgi:hypothetical protein